MKKNLILFISFLLLTNCSSVKNNTPILLGSSNMGMTCAGVINDPAVIATCAAAGAIVAVDQVFNDDFNTHKKYFQSVFINLLFAIGSIRGALSISCFQFVF